MQEQVGVHRKGDQFLLRIAKLYDLWYEQKENILKTYTQTMPERIPLSQNEELGSIRNAIVTEAFTLALGLDVVEEPEEESIPDREPTEDEVESVTDEDQEPKKKWELYRRAKELLDGDVLLQDIPEAIRLLGESADSGFSQAQYVLGKLLYRGELTEQDIPKALEYLEKASAQKNPYAAYLAGRIRLTEDAHKDIAKAIRHFEIAAKCGNDYAEYQLGKLYLYGKDIPQDYDKAIEYLTASAEHGNKYAEQLLHNIKNNRNLSAGMGVFRLFHHLGRLLQNQLNDDRNGAGGVDRKIQILFELVCESDLISHKQVPPSNRPCWYNP